MNDAFVRRNLAAAHNRRREAGTMAGALDVTRAYALKRKEQQRLNAEAAAAADEQRRSRLGGAKMGAGPSANKMAPGPSANKAMPMKPSPVSMKGMPPAATAATVGPPPEPPKGKEALRSGVTLDGVPFASRAARVVADEYRMTAGHFAGRTPRGKAGFTVADVHEAAE